MVKLAYLDCPTGIAGDMCLGALVHAGVPLEYLTEKLSLLGISNEYELWTELVHRNGQQATKVHVDLVPDGAQTVDAAVFTFDHPNKSSSDHPHGPDKHGHSPASHSHPDHAAGRHLPEIEQLIRAAGLPTRSETWSLAIFRQLAEAEAAVHGISPEQVHFHEVGAIDAIIDIVGTCLGLDWLNIEHLYCSPMPTGGGTVRAAHGLLPVPVPAVLKLWEMRQVPIYSNGIHRELVTPTGAAIVTTLATQFGSPPPMTLQKVGLGAGSRELTLPNILRLWIGEAGAPIAQTSQKMKKEQAEENHPSSHHPLHMPQSAIETISVLETQIDDLTPQAIGYVFEALFAAGALDVFTQAIGMKKSRPGVLLTVLCLPDQVQACESIIFRETSTLGIRHMNQQRTILKRSMQTVETPYGPVRMKVACRGTSGRIIHGHPEYEDCAHLARQAHVPWQEVHRLALCAWHQQMQTH